MPTTLLFDGHNLLHRALGSRDAVLAPDGRDVRGVVRVLRGLRMDIQQFAARRAVLFFDGGRSARRMRIFPEYKANRDPKTAVERAIWEAERRVFDEQLAAAAESALALGVRVVRLAGCEGDDLIAAATMLVDDHVVIVGDDGDLLQLVNRRVNVFRPMKQEYVTEETFGEHSAVALRWYLLGRAIVGDRSDGIAGVAGVGKVTVRDLLAHDWPDADAIRAYCAGSTERRLQAVARDWPLVLRNMELTDLRNNMLTDTQIESLSEALTRPVRCESHRALIQKLGKLGVRNLGESFSSWVSPFEALR